MLHALAFNPVSESKEWPHIHFDILAIIDIHYAECLTWALCSGISATPGHRSDAQRQPWQDNQYHFSWWEVWRTLHVSLFCFQACSGRHVRQPAKGAAAIWNRCHSCRSGLSVEALT